MAHIATLCNVNSMSVQCDSLSDFALPPVNFISSSLDSLMTSRLTLLSPFPLGKLYAASFLLEPLVKCQRATMLYAPCGLNSRL